mgnify:FL=1
MADLTARISALLAKADRTDNAHEAEAYVLKAQSLATMASIDIAAARLRTNQAERSRPVSRTVIIGEKGKRANQHLIALFVTVAHNNSVQVDVASDSTFVIAYGMPRDLDNSELLFATISVQMVASAGTFINEGSWKGETYIARGTMRTRKNFTAQTARAAFYRSYVARIGDRLSEAREAGIKESDANPERNTASSNGALVLRTTEKEVRDFHRSTSTARGRWSGYSGGARSTGSAAREGRSAASRARLTEQREIGNARGKLGR